MTTDTAPDSGHPARILAPPPAEELFERWLDKRSTADRRDRLSPQSAKPYRSIWRTWQKWIAAPTQSLAPCPWHKATPSHLSAFLVHGISPSTTRRSIDNTSEITRRRYWRVLDMLYEYALAMGMIDSNPARHLLEPRPDPEQPEGQVFHAHLWNAVRDALPKPESNSTWDIRDRAILLLLMDAALTTGEICTLQIPQVADHLQQPALRVDGKRAAQERTLQLERDTGQALRRWMDLRRKMSCPQAQPDAVFTTKRGVAMSPRAVFHLVSTTIRRGFTMHSIELPNHIGAQVFRNTRIVMWLNSGVDPEEVVRRAGYKNAWGFPGLRQHLNRAATEQLRSHQNASEQLEL